jgi:hypothetical protein
MPNLENRRALFLMQHKGIPYRIVQTSNPTGWKWTIEIPGKPHKSGQAINRTVAFRKAQIAIDRAIKANRLDEALRPGWPCFPPFVVE